MVTVLQNKNKKTKKKKLKIFGLLSVPIEILKYSEAVGPPSRWCSVARGGQSMKNHMRVFKIDHVEF